MKAIVFSEYGSPDGLRLCEVEPPVPKRDEVLVKVRAASINDWDLGILRGATLLDRLMHGLFRPKVRILGCDVAGRVEAVGEGVTAFQPGDEVFGDLCACGFGGFAEYVCAREGALALKPAGMTFEQAAAIPQAGMLALQGLRDAGHLQPGQRLLINGAGGGVGTFALQLAKECGAEVTAVDRAEKLDLCRSLGADHVLDYAQADFTRTGQRYDLILDVKTNRPVFAYLRALRPRGTYVTVGGSLLRLLQAFLLGPWISRVHKKRIRIVALKPNKDLAHMKDLFEAGKVVPVIEGPYALSEVPAALKVFERGDHQGKMIITMA